MTLWFYGQKGEGAADPSYFTSAPGVGAGSTSGFYAAAGFMLGGAGNQSAGILSNRDQPNSRGWRIRIQTLSGNILRFFADIGRSDGTTLTVQNDVMKQSGVAYYISLYVGEGPDADVSLDLNSVNLVLTSLGAGLTFVPAAGQPLSLGANGTGINWNQLSDSIRWLGAGFKETDPFVLADSPSRQMGYVEMVRTESFACFVGSSGGVVHFPPGLDIAYDYGWSTKNLLQSGLQVNFFGNPPNPNRDGIGQVGFSWSPDIGDQILTRQDPSVILTPMGFYNAPANWASIAPPFP